MDDYLKKEDNFVPLDENELEFLTDLAVNESQRWIEAVTRNKFDHPDFLESLEDGALLCEVVEQIWPRYLQLDDDASSDNSFTRFYGQHNLDAFRAAAHKLGLNSDYIFLEKHIHAPERYICTPSAQEAIQETLIRVTVTVFLLGCRSKDTPTYTGPQLDLSAFTQLFQHYLHHFHRRDDTLCNQIDQSSADSKLSFAGNSVHHPQSESVTVSTIDASQPAYACSPDSLVSSLTETMPNQVLSDEGEYSTFSVKHGYELYRSSKDTFYADSIGSSNDSACGSSSPSVDIHGNRGRSEEHRDEYLGASGMSPRRSSAHSSTTSTSNPLQFVKIKIGSPSSSDPKSLRTEFIQVEDIKQKIKDDELEWQMNLNQWKSKRKTHVPEQDVVDHNTDRPAVPSEHLTTFPAMIAARMKEGKGIPSFLEDSFEDDFRPSRCTKNDSPTQADKVFNAAVEGSEKDSSSGISSPRSSRSLVSVSPTPLAYTSRAIPASDRPSAGPTEIRPAPAKKIIYLTPIVANSAPSEVTQNSKSTQGGIHELDSSTSPSVETAFKPFNEKLAMFRKADTEEEVVSVDMDKCNYKDLAKPEMSLKEKLSMFERSINQEEEKIAISPRISSAKLPKWVPPEQPTSPVSKASTGGLSRLLSKDFAHQALAPSRHETMNVVKDNSFDTSRSPERYLEEIDMLTGVNYPRKGSRMSNIAETSDLPPPPLPSIAPPPVTEKITEPEAYSFPPPPPSNGFPVMDESANNDRKLQETILVPSVSTPTSSAAPDASLRRVGSTKRIKTEILKRRSDFFGIQSDDLSGDVTQDAVPEKPRPVSLHEVKVPSSSIVQSVPAQSTIRSVPRLNRDEERDLERTQKELVDLLEKEEEQWRNRDQRPMKTKEHMIATIVAEYKTEMRKEQILEADKENAAKSVESQPVRSGRESTGILKAKNKDQRDAVLQETKPINQNLTADRMADMPEMKPDVRTAHVSQMAENRHFAGSYETAYREQVRTSGFASVDSRPSPRGDSLSLKTEQPYHRNDPRLALNLQHYRDISDGGYSSGRSDPGNYGFNSAVLVPESTLEAKPERPSMPTEFRPPAVREPEIVSEKFQPKMESVRKAVSNATSQKRCLDQEAELRRLAELEERHRQLQAQQAQSAPLQYLAAVSSPLAGLSKPVGQNAKSSVPNHAEMVQYSKSVREIPITLSQDYAADTGFRQSATVPRLPEVSRVPVARSSQPADFRSRSAVLPTLSQRNASSVSDSRPTHRYQQELTPIVHYPPPHAHYPQHYQPQPSVPRPYQQCPPSVSSSHLSLQSNTNSLLSQRSLGSVANGHHHPISDSRLDQSAAVSARRKCSHCGHELGVGAAMVVEHLQLYYHVACFKCCVCGQRLGNGSKGADVHVRNAKLHCSYCSSDDKGLQESLL